MGYAISFGDNWSGCSVIMAGETNWEAKPLYLLLYG